jgi:hypothetical protein
MSKFRRMWYIQQLIAAALLLAAWYVHSRRPRERVANLEGIEDAEAARAFG